MDVHPTKNVSIGIDPYPTQPNSTNQHDDDFNPKKNGDHSSGFFHGDIA